LFFYRQDVASLVACVKEFLSREDSFEPERVRRNAEQFPRSRFERELKAFVDDAWERFPYKS
jgi:hypothetical protein